MPDTNTAAAAGFHHTGVGDSPGGVEQQCLARRVGINRRLIHQRDLDPSEDRSRVIGDSADNSSAGTLPRRGGC